MPEAVDFTQDAVNNAGLLFAMLNALLAVVFASHMASWILTRIRRLVRRDVDEDDQQVVVVKRR